MPRALSLEASPLADQDNGRVRVVAASPEHRETLAELLRRSGREVELVDCVGPHGPGPDGVPTAVVVGHRTGGRAVEGRTLADLVRLCALGDARVLAFTDSDEEAVIVGALEAGARQVFRTDESERVTLARLDAALRRPVSRRDEVLRVAPFGFDLSRRRVSFHDEVLDLSPREFDLAYYLFDHRGRVVTNAELLTSVWSLPQGIDSRRIDTAVCRVRRKMHLGSDSGWVLRRFRREGYGLYQDSRDESRAPVVIRPPGGGERRGAEAPDEG